MACEIFEVDAHQLPLTPRLEVEANGKDNSYAESCGVYARLFEHIPQDFYLITVFQDEICAVEEEEN